ncbi:hypothetical protein C8R43DRAFT_951992 [Mycena crocata]|nr:hypothetical protein C8R43DRAFT_951992 [Mycena crocata]
MRCRDFKIQGISRMGSAGWDDVESLAEIIAQSATFWYQQFQHTPLLRSLTASPQRCNGKKKRRMLNQLPSRRKLSNAVDEPKPTAAAVRKACKEHRELMRSQLPPVDNNATTTVWDSEDWDAGMQSLLDNAADLGYYEAMSDEEGPGQRWQDKPITCYRGFSAGGAQERELALLNRVCWTQEMLWERDPALDDIASAFRQRLLRAVLQSTLDA